MPRRSLRAWGDFLYALVRNVKNNQPAQTFAIEWLSLPLSSVCVGRNLESELVGKKGEK